MNPYLARLRSLESRKQAPSGTDKTDKTYPGRGFVGFVGAPGCPFFESGHGKSPEGSPFPAAPQRLHERRDDLRRVLDVLRGGCLDLVDHDRWHRAVADGERFLAEWAEQARQLGWTARDLFSLHEPPESPHPSYRRLSRYDATGLIWLLEGREVIALTADTAAIRWPSGSVTIYHKNNKPASGPLGDSPDDFQGPS